jgi:endoglucanase
VGHASATSAVDRRPLLDRNFRAPPDAAKGRYHCPIGSIGPHTARRVGNLLIVCAITLVIGIGGGIGAPTFVSQAAAGSPSQNPLAREPFFVTTGTPARIQADIWSNQRPVAAHLMAKIAAQPTAIWLGHEYSDHAYVTSIIHKTVRQKSLPIFVTYFLPHRDCGGYSAGGAKSAANYKQWIDGIATAIGDHTAGIIVEPDALPELSCWKANLQIQQLHLIRYAVATLSRLPHTSIYLDAGNRSFGGGWIHTMAFRLREAGIANARGFSVNVANFGPVSAEVEYGKRLLAALHGKWHFVIDTSRDGRGWAPGDPWCNPPGRGLGPTPTTATVSPLVDAYLWIKMPGSSDGLCNGGPPAGDWWPSQALELALNAVQ